MTHFLFLILSAYAICTTYGQNLDKYIVSQMDNAHIAALSVVVVKNSTILFENAYGLSNPNKTHGLVNNTNETIFDLASISKTVTSFGVMSLFDKGLFQLDDAINKYLPFNIFNPHYANKEITIRQLLTHMSSISDTMYYNIYPLVVSEGDTNISLAEFMYDMFDTKGKYYSQLSFHLYAPGAQWDYSNMGVTLAGYVAECIINSNNDGDYITFDEYVLNNIFTPMKDGINGDIGFHLADFKYDTNNNIFAMPSSWNIGTQKYTTYCLYCYPDYPDGLWRSSAFDYHYLFSTFIDGGKSMEHNITILSESTVNEMKTIQPGTPANEHQGIVWYYKHQDGRQMLGHNGGDDGVCTEAFFNPITGVGYIIFGNCDWNPQVSLAFQNIEVKLLDTFDTNGDVLNVKDDPIAVRRHRSKGNYENITAIMPCNLPF